MKNLRYRVGIDVGLNSVGLAAIEVDSDDNPLRILNAQSVIHDGGVDPQSQKTADSRRQQAGIARRTRRMRRNRVKRLKALDNWLISHNYPVYEADELDWFEAWKVRDQAATAYIEDDEDRQDAISIAMRHIANHRGWRNPYMAIENLLDVQLPESNQYFELREAAEQQCGGQELPEDATPAQLICAVLDYNDGRPIRVRTSTGSKKIGDREGLIHQRLMQTDNAYEVRKILSTQRIPEDQIRELIRLVFAAKSPKGSATERVGSDPLDPSQKRALKASLAFQRYRILNMLTNIRIAENGAERPLTVEEKQHVYEFLMQQTSDKVTWGDVAEQLQITRHNLKGVGKQTEDGEDRVSSRPPVVVTTQRIAALKDSKLRKSLQQWWDTNNDDAREAMIELLSNSVDIDKVRDELRYAEAIDFIEQLDDDTLAKLDTVDLPAGRAAYSAKTLKALTERMLTTADDLHEARKVLFNISDDWRPAQPAIGAPIGNPAVDRVLKIVNRYLMNIEQRWGKPASIQIEHVRGGFNSTKTARDMKNKYERSIADRTKYRDEIKQQLASLGVDTVREYDVRRLEAITRQNGKCLYCGRTITFFDCEMDHIVPRRGTGSTNTRNNFAAVCEYCNRAKSNTPFAVWCTTDSAKERGVSLKDAINRVKMFNINPLEYRGREATNFKQSIISRLKQTELDDPIDNRSIESVAWMADELHRRIDWHFNRSNDAQPDATKVGVFRGSITASARKASGIEGRIHFIHSHTKTRLDRRHHAIDAAVIAMMRPGVAQILTERDNLRRSQMITNTPDVVFGDWRNYPTESARGYHLFQAWLGSMNSLVNLLNDALDADRVHVLYPQRLALGNSIAHDATIHALKKIPLGDAIDAETIRRSATPAQYCALTRLPDYDEKEGLPENLDRTIQVNGHHLGPADNVEFFAGPAAQIAVQQGSADIGSAIHHARVYRCWKTQKNGKRKEFFGMIRVFQTDLLKYRHDDLFTCPLPPQSISMRYADPKTTQAVARGDAEYIGYLLINDVIELHFGEAEKSQIGDFLDFARPDSSINPGIANKWVLVGMPEAARLKLRPLYFASEGLQNIENVEKSVCQILGNGWRPTFGVVAEHHARILRRNALGDQRITSEAHLPVSWELQ
ncbi:HNH endonuclease [Bifidobacterium dolichotidis]|uniref:HNH endonuclease n=1 Tax=Bifidobacterium dolichotidis TaxID=2306976 RepID=A0A430FRV1_9BIFI|nr:type II CRISPR RNA-guided endonuclease Cas9 [Bifidobacterium dolichotidis]RSX55612.1 HNH endonuclease [Bifidobacterium dolichotidis]